MATAVEAPAPQRLRLSERAPGWLFHGCCAVAALALLWLFTTPAMGPFWFVLLSFLLTVLAAVWLLRLIVVLVRTRRVPRRFGLAPVGGLVVLLLLGAGLPLEARWAVSKGAFQDVAAEAPATGPLEVPERIGAYRVSGAERVAGGIVFRLPEGGAYDGGFAYLPQGPAAVIDADHFEAPQFWSLGDGWYRWTSTW